MTVITTVFMLGMTKFWKEVLKGALPPDENRPAFGLGLD